MCAPSDRSPDPERVGEVEEEAQRTAREVAQLEVRVHSEVCDVRDAEAVRGFVDRARSALGGVHILVNNAGIAHDRALWMLTDQQWRDVLDTNLTGAFYMLRADTPILRGQRDGKIVTVASVHAIRGEIGIANGAFGAMKGKLLNVAFAQRPDVRFAERVGILVAEACD